MRAGIVGLPNVGKSTLFNALTSSKQAQAANYPFCTIEPNEGVVSIPDDRLARICKYIPPKKIVPTAMRLVDIAGIVKGASEGQGLGNKFLSHIREVDAILQVVRCFEDSNVVHVAGEVNPLSDVETIEIELMLSDIQSLDTALPKAERTAKSGDKEALARVEAIKKCQAHLATNEPLRKLSLTDDEKKSLSSFGLLTAKPILYVANVDENDLAGQGPLVTMLRNYATSIGASVVPVCAKLEAEIAELSEADRAEMLTSLGVKEPALAVLARTAYAVLGLQTYFTAGEKEVRAWTVPVGATAPQAAGVIHTDFEKGFIRAEIYCLADLEKYQSESDIRAAGKLRTEGKSYVMQDGDICHFLFN
ncbi:MAG TPA: redox-regulated ATPase YchF [Gemmatales bacterium]|nr:redox-regulated ATPase YchF [Gemmatales bacterium]